ncbi:MAG: ATPase [Treponemataceae bacterium]|nr:ATPase [Treponemataceae bacterium]
MARTTQMSLIEIMAMSQDVSNVIEYLGKKGCFQFQSKKHDAVAEKKEEAVNIDREIFDNLQKARLFLNISDLENDALDCPRAGDDERNEATKIIGAVSDLFERFETQNTEVARIESAYNEAMAFSNLKVSYSELEHLSFLSIRIGKIPAENINALKESLGSEAVIISLGNDTSRIMAVSSKKGRFSLDTELKRFGFVNMEIPHDFKGIPEDALTSLRLKRDEAQRTLAVLEEEKRNFAETHEASLKRLLASFSVAYQVFDIKNSLESTALVYRLTGWIPSDEVSVFMSELDQMTEGRIAIREYLPMEVPSVISGKEQVPVKLKHGKFVSSFERLIFSYGSPFYGTIDPTPFVAVFFTVLFGIMFGDCGQGLVFLLVGILMAAKKIKVGGWNKFAPIFMAIGCSSAVMGLITGEFFTNETLLKPFALWVTGLFGTPRAPILKVMPSASPNSIKIVFGIFGVTIALGFIINTVGLIINIINKILQKKWGSALFGKIGLAGALFFWYVVAFAIRIAAFKHSPTLCDWIVIGGTLFFAAFGEPFERLLDGKRPILENGMGAMVIGGIVELIEVVSTYLSNSISFVRVGAFALAHAVLGFIISMMAEKCGMIGGIFVLIAGNAIVIVLEGMIVAIQVIRLQYYEFFSKFFSETGSEFRPLQFRYGK